MSNYAYTDPTPRFRAAYGLQVILAITTLGTTFAELVTIDFVAGVETGDFVLGAFSEVHVDNVASVAYGLWLAGYVAAGVASLMLIYRFAANVHAAAGDMDISPGWSVGWYFIPIANLWKPYQAMGQIWRASGAGEARLGLWWTFWIIGSVTGNISGRIAWRAETLEDYERAAYVGLVDNIVSLVVIYLFLRVLTRLCDAQRNDSFGRVAAVFD